LSHKLEVGERRSLASRYTLTTADKKVTVCSHILRSYELDFSSYIYLKSV